jgi:RimK family alpha-L-glutamate ligase
MAKYIALLGDPDSWHVGQLARAFGARGWRVRVDDARDRRQWEAGLREAQRPDVLWVRQLSSGNTEQTIFRMDLLYHWAFQGTWVINPPQALERTVDKYFTQLLLEHAGVPVVPTVVTEDRDTVMDLIDRWGKVVVKPLFGSQGKGILLLEDREVGWRVINTLSKVGSVFVVQPFVQYRQDVRVLVAAGAVMGQMGRRSRDWRANLARGGEPVQVALPAETLRLAQSACDALHCWYAGVDLLEMPNGQWAVLEVNGVAGWQGLQRLTRFNIAERLAEEVDHALERRGHSQLVDRSGI